MNVVVVYPGRFHPFHKGHKATYDYLTKKFGEANVYVATSGVQSPIDSPFSYTDKVTMMTKMGVPASKIVKVKNPYQAQEITQEVPDPENTALIFAVSEKDKERFKFGKKKNGEPSYMQPYQEKKKLEPLTKHAYVIQTPKVDFKVRGANTDSASQIRKRYSDGNENDKIAIITDLYGEADAAIKDIFDKRLASAKEVQDVVYKKAPLDANVIHKTPRVGMMEHRAKVAKLIQTVLLAEQRAREAYEPINEDLIEDYLPEKRL